MIDQTASTALINAPPASKYTNQKQPEGLIGLAHLNYALAVTHQKRQTSLPFRF